MEGQLHQSRGGHYDSAPIYIQRLHALDIRTGEEKFVGPVVIQASVPGRGDRSTGGRVPFHSLREHQRGGLLLLNGVVYIPWASPGDNGPYHGWVIGYDARTLEQLVTEWEPRSRFATGAAPGPIIPL